MKGSDVGYGGGCIFSYFLAFIQTNEVMQVISFVLSTIASVLIIVLRLWAWWKEARKDGKIDKTEIEDAIDILEDHRKDK